MDTNWKNMTGKMEAHPQEKRAGGLPLLFSLFLGLALLSTIGGQFVFNLLLKKLPASAVTMSILGEPIGTCILAYLFLHESISLQQLVGIVVIIGGLSIYFVLPERKAAC